MTEVGELTEVGKLTEVGQLTVVGELLWLAGDCEVPGLHSPPA